MQTARRTKTTGSVFSIATAACKSRKALVGLKHASREVGYEGVGIGGDTDEVSDWRGAGICIEVMGGCLAIG